MNSTEHATVLELIISILIISFVVLYHKKKSNIQLRKIIGAEKILYSISLAAESGKTVSFSTGITSLGAVFYGCMNILSEVAKKAAKLKVNLIVPQNNSESLTFVDSTLQESYRSINQLSFYNSSQIRFLSEEQFAFAAGYSGLMHRENVGVALLFGSFAGESLILAESGQQVGAYQIAASISPEQVPFFICTCDEVLIGEEFFSVSAYLSDDSESKISLRIQDIFRIIIMIIIVLGSIYITFFGL
jgi:hypothetical protein